MTLMTSSTRNPSSLPAVRLSAAVAALREGKVLYAFAVLHDQVTGFHPRLPWYGFIADLDTVQAARRRAQLERR